MPNLPTSELNRLLAKLPVKDRKQYASIIQGKVSHNVYCDKGSKDTHKKGELIGRIYVDGTVRGEKDAEGQMFLKSSRTRTDGSLGFECWCGNDSRRSPEEMDVFDDGGNAPDQEELVALFKKVGGKGTSVKEITNKAKIDGFTIEAVE